MRSAIVSVLVIVVLGRIGGDVVVTEINGNGHYVRGTVMRATHTSSAE